MRELLLYETFYFFGIVGDQIFLQKYLSTIDQFQQFDVGWWFVEKNVHTLQKI